MHFGVDTGPTSGAIVGLAMNSGRTEVLGAIMHRMPKTVSDLAAELCYFCREYPQAHWAVEHSIVSVKQGSGLMSGLALTRNEAFIHGVLMAQSSRGVKLITPQTWQKALPFTSPEKPEGIPKRPYKPRRPKRRKKESVEEHDLRVRDWKIHMEEVYEPKFREFLVLRKQAGPLYAQFKREHKRAIAQAVLQYVPLEMWPKHAVVGGLKVAAAPVMSYGYADAAGIALVAADFNFQGGSDAEGEAG